MFELFMTTDAETLAAFALWTALPLGVAWMVS